MMMKLKTIKRWLLLMAGTLLLVVTAQGQPIAFPGAEGYGRFASGGRGDGTNGVVVEVTNLLDDATNPPEGSFRWALEQGIGYVNHPILGKIPIKRPLTVVFKVGGVIDLAAELRIQRSNLTIAGQTAPGDGICFKGATLNFSGSNNVIVRYIRSRPGVHPVLIGTDDVEVEETSAFRIENGGNYIIDHCSFSWAVEETTHFSSSDDLTVQWCIISESLYNAGHAKGARGYGTQWGGEYASYHHNLLAHHNSRMPRINGSNENDKEALVDYRNNINYNWVNSGAFYGGEWENTNGEGFCATNVVNCYFKPGPATLGSYFASPSKVRSGRTFDGYADWFFGGNIMTGNEARTGDNWLGVDASSVGGVDNIRVDEITLKTRGVEGNAGDLEDYDSYTETAEEAYVSVLANAGATLPKRDEIDARVIGEVKGEIAVLRYNYTEIDGRVTPSYAVHKGIIDTQYNLVPDDAPEGTSPWDVYETVTAGEALLDTDSDGMPDAWETENGLDPNNGDDFRLITASGYSNLELYLNGLTGVTTSVNEVIEVSSDLILYPQPMKDVLNYSSELPVYRIDIYNMQGQQVKLAKLRKKQGTVNVSKLAKGNYVAIASLEGGVVIAKKIIKE